MSSSVRATLLVVGVFATGLVSGAMTGAAAAARAHDPYAGLDLFARILTTIEADYVEEIPQDRLIDAAIRGMVSELDEHSRWLSSGEHRALRDDTRGTYEGLGIEFRRARAGIEISRVIPGSPAGRDGLRSGDLILAVDDQPLGDLELEAVEQRLRGARGEPVLLTVTRSGWEAPKQVRTVRDQVRVPPAEVALLDGGVAYARLVQFQEGAARELEREVQKLGSTKVRALVLDLRDNPGGLLEEAVAVADLFLDDGIIVSTRGRLEGAVTHRATPGGFRSDLPVVVLVNAMSASASEIVAAALQDTGRARLVGTPTYGKGSVQTLFRNRDDSALKLTIGRYYTPSGQPVADHDGRAPDHLVPWPEHKAPLDTLRERLGALDVPHGQRLELLALLDDAASSRRPDARPLLPWDDPPRERASSDPQLRAALDLLRRP